MNSPTKQTEPASIASAPRIALVAMLIIVAGIALVSLFSNVQRLRQEKVESVKVLPAASPSPASP